MNSTDPPLENYTHLRCKEAADRFLNSTSALKRGKIPVDVELAAQRYGIRVHAIPGIVGRSGTKAVAFKKMPEGRYEILIDLRHYENDEQSVPFTIAEEVGHILIHSKIFDAVKTPEDRIALERKLDTQTSQLLEMQAKRVASNIVLPSELFDPFILNWCRTHLGEILQDRPANEKDLAYYISMRLQPKLNISLQILQRALERWTPEPLVSRIAREHSIQFFSK